MGHSFYELNNKHYDGLNGGKMSEETFIAVYTVILPNGHELKHEYIMHANQKMALELVGNMGRTIGAAFGGGKLLVFQGPSAVYNVSNISGVRAEFIGPEKLKTTIEEATRNWGFTKK